MNWNCIWHVNKQHWLQLAEAELLKSSELKSQPMAPMKVLESRFVKRSNSGNHDFNSRYRVMKVGKI